MGLFCNVQRSEIEWVDGLHFVGGADGFKLSTFFTHFGVSQPCGYGSK
jgi:hypothetical protein